MKGDLARLHALHGGGTASDEGATHEKSDGTDLIQDLTDDPDAADYEQYRHQRRRSRAVLYQLSGSYDKTKNTKTKIQLNKVSTKLKSLQPIYNRTKQKHYD